MKGRALHREQKTEQQQVKKKEIILSNLKRGYPGDTAGGTKKSEKDG